PDCCGLHSLRIGMNVTGEMPCRPAIDQSGDPKALYTDARIAVAFLIVVRVQHAGDHVYSGSDRCEAAHYVGIKEHCVNECRGFRIDNASHSHDSREDSAASDEAHIESLT